MDKEKNSERRRNFARSENSNRKSRRYSGQLTCWTFKSSCALDETKKFTDWGKRMNGSAGWIAKSRWSRNYFLRSLHNRSACHSELYESPLSPSLSSPPLFLCPKLYSKPVHNTSLTETRRSDSNPEVRKLIAMGWPLCTGIHEQFVCSRTRVTFKNGPLNSVHTGISRLLIRLYIFSAQVILPHILGRVRLRIELLWNYFCTRYNLSSSLNLIIASIFLVTLLKIIWKGKRRNVISSLWWKVVRGLLF